MAGAEKIWADLNPNRPAVGYITYQCFGIEYYSEWKLNLKQVDSLPSQNQCS